ncbi:esterase-like activity of phytase family protein [Caldovatus sp. SYSU G05006]|uniref:Esterase-like activity of phytase family protein n=1 Tax=Caldovatus aquaticus TaxID=2865671 RepID=A0ABS7F0R0_9PROT|nr:esterase-like activity of phytase family protein [Caldovatus aquaticus]
MTPPAQARRPVGGPGRRAFCLALAAGLARPSLGAAEAGPGRAPAAPIALPPAAYSAGALRPLGALALDTAAIGFGGLSGLHLDAALQLTAVSDLGRHLTARLVLGEDGAPLGLDGLRTGRLRDGSGAPLPRGYAADAEALARLADGTWLVAFERWHRIRAYPRGLDGPGGYVAAPPGLERAPRNAGLEALAVLADGRWLAVAEGLAPPGAPALRRAWIGAPGHWTPLAYRPGASELDPADAAPLPDGGALVLERSFSLLDGFRGRLVRIPAAALAAPHPETVLEGEALLRLEPPLPTDNWEGVAAARIGGRTLVALVSDDNESPLQRTLLLLFALDGV